jgi:hypothetical protein
MNKLIASIVGILSIVAMIAIGSAIYFWYQHQKLVLNPTTYVTAPKIQVVTKIKEVKVPGPTQIVTIEKQVLVEKLKLPDWIKNDADEQAIATAAIEPYKGTTNAVALLNTKTGVGQIVAKQEPLSLFGFVNEKEIGIRAGINKSEQEITVYGHWNFARVGKVNIGMYAEGNTHGDARAALQVGYQF